MTKLFALFTALLCTSLVWADNTQKNVSGKIEKVTVFSDGAQVTRSGKATVVAGKTDIVFSKLSPYLDNSSISVSATGATVVSVSQQVNHLNEQKKRDEQVELEKRKEEYSHQVEDQENMKAVYDEEVEMLQKNQLVNSQHTDLKTIDLKAALDFHEQRLTELRKTLLTYTRSIKKLNDSITSVNAQLNAINAKQDLPTSDVVVSVKSAQGGEVSFTLSYFVNYAGWYPTYDLRVDDISKPMNISYRANVHQNTGEEWKDIKLTLSNAEPKTSGIKPEIRPWYLRNGNSLPTVAAISNTGYYNPYSYKSPNATIREVHGHISDDKGESLPYVNILVRGTTIGTASDEKGNYTLQLPSGENYLMVNYVGFQSQELPVFSNQMNIKMSYSSANLDEVAIVADKKMQRNTVNQNSVGYALYAGRQDEKFSAPPVYNIETSENFTPTTFTYDIETPYTIPNDGKVYAVDIKQQDIATDYLYITVPRLEKAAFLMARIPDWNDYNLLSGEANLYFEGTYIGKTLLNANTDNDTLEISLGRDKGLTVTRTRQKDYSKKSFFGDKKTDSRAFDISVRNNKKQAVHILVQDQVPLSTQKEIEVDKEYTGAKLDESTGQLTWTLDITPATEKKVSFKYDVKYPKDYRIQLE